MFTVAAQNTHQATPSAFGMMKAEAVKVGKDWLLPVPLSVITFRPWQRVSLWQELGNNPYRLFLDGLLTMSPHEWDGFKIAADCPTSGLLEGHLPNMVRTLQESRFASITLRSCEGDPVTSAILMSNVEGALDLAIASVDGDLAEDVLGFIPVRYSFVQELVASAAAMPIGVCYHVAQRARLSHRREHLFEVVAGGNEPRQCPYLTDDGEPLPIEAHAGVRSLPLGRWHRELSTLLKAGPESPPGEDQWLEGVARPLWRSWRAFQEKSADHVENARRALLGLPALDWAQGAWEWLEAQEVKP